HAGPGARTGLVLHDALLLRNSGETDPEDNPSTSEPLSATSQKKAAAMLTGHFSPFKQNRRFIFGSRAADGRPSRPLLLPAPLPLTISRSTPTGTGPIMNEAQPRGLTAAEVAERIRRGQVNRTPSSELADYLNIIGRNVFTLFNLMVTPAAI